MESCILHIYEIYDAKQFKNDIVKYSITKHKNFEFIRNTKNMLGKVCPRELSMEDIWSIE